MARNVTIKDIAREAGVSIALVSFVMNNRVEANGKNKYRVSEDTKRRILEVAERMNYRPSSAARMLRQGRTHVVGVILSDLSNIFYGCIAKYMENIMYQNGYTVLFSSTEEDPERFGRLVQLSLARDVEGFIVVPPEGGETYVKQLQESGKPFVVIDRYHPDLDVPSVLVDNVGAIHTAIDCLRRQGAKNIAMASYSMRISSMMDRERGFREEMGEDAPSTTWDSTRWNRMPKKRAECWKKSFLLAVKSRDYYANLCTFLAFCPSSRSAVRQGN